MEEMNISHTSVAFPVVIIFGGTGFIGSHFAEYLLDNRFAEKIILADLKPLLDERREKILRKMSNDCDLKYIEIDVRQPIDKKSLPMNCDLICNFAAIHREPGHKDWEYFYTNLKGATNVCEWAGEIGCSRLIFTSSIAPYGASLKPKDENSIPVPITPYGSSKLVAEKIHIAWQSNNAVSSKLVIVRPGVVFGPGEGGNVTRLIRAVIGRYFLYFGNKKTIKAGIYIKELCHAMNWVLNNQKKIGENISLVNMTMNPAPSVKDYVTTICSVAKINRFTPSFPYEIVYILSFVIGAISKSLRIVQPVSPVRIRKLVKSNNIIPAYLKEHGYNFQFTLNSAFEDWKKENPADWK
jgi:GlcNAc-P-P-Und epimerase